MQTKNYYPEMGQERPAAQLELQLCHSGKHTFIDTPLDLERMRGLTFIKQYTTDDFYPGKTRRVGWREYKATYAALKILQEKYVCSREVLLG